MKFFRILKNNSNNTTLISFDLIRWVFKIIVKEDQISFFFDKKREGFDFLNNSNKKITIKLEK